MYYDCHKSWEIILNNQPSMSSRLLTFIQRFPNVPRSLNITSFSNLPILKIQWRIATLTVSPSARILRKKPFSPHIRIHQSKDQTQELILRYVRCYRCHEAERSSHGNITFGLSILKERYILVHRLSSMFLKQLSRISVTEINSLLIVLCYSIGPKVVVRQSSAARTCLLMPKYLSGWKRYV